MQVPVEIYTADYCGYCRAAKRLLDRKGVTYTEIDVTNDLEKRRWLAEATGQQTVPQVWIGGKPAGGYTDIAALDKAGALDPMLAGLEVGSTSE